MTRRPPWSTRNGCAGRASWPGDLLIVMRVYFEKPRTVTGWTGLLTDPGMDGTTMCTAGCGSQAAAARHRDAGPADSLRVAQPGGAALFLRRGGLGRYRRAHHREPDPPPARLGPADAGGVQERHRRRRPGRRRSLPGRRPPRTPTSGSTRRLDRDRQQRGQPARHVVLRGGRSGPNYAAAGGRQALDTFRPPGCRALFW